MSDVQMQAKSDTDGALYTWNASAPDFVGAGFPGPGSALDVAVSMRPGSSGAGGGLSVSGTPAAGYVPTWNGVGAVWASPTAFNITSFAAATPTVEVGSTVTNPAFTAAYSGAVVTAVLTNNKTAEAKDVHLTPTSFSSSASHAFTTVGEAWTFTDTATGAITGDTATASITARQRNVAGVVAVGNTSPATLYAAATASALASSGAFSFPVTDDGTHEVQFFRRATYGTPSSVKDSATGFAVSFSLVGTYSWTNPSGFSENVNLYKLDNPINTTVSGPKTIAVI